MSERKKKSKTKELTQELESFFFSDLAVKAASGLSDRACIAVHIDGKPFFFQKQNGKNKLHPEEPQSPDVHFWLHESTLRHILDAAEAPGAGIASIGIVIFEHILSKKEADKIKFRLDAKFLSLWTKGYFSVLKAGGADVAAYLGKMGLSMAKIKDIVLKNFRG